MQVFHITDIISTLKLQGGPSIGINLNHQLFRFDYDNLVCRRRGLVSSVSAY